MKLAEVPVHELAVDFGKRALDVVLVQGEYPLDHRRGTRVTGTDVFAAGHEEVLDAVAGSRTPCASHQPLEYVYTCGIPSHPYL